MSTLSKVTSSAEYPYRFQASPREVKMEIFTRLPISKLLEAALVCTEWCELTKDAKLPLVKWLQDKQQAKYDVIWLRNLSGVCNRTFNFSKVPSDKSPFKERSALLNQLSQNERDDRRAAFAVASEHGNIHMGELLLPFVPKRNWDIPAGFAKCAEKAQPDFARWLISTNPKDVVDLTGLTTLKVKCDIGYGNNLFLHGEDLNRFLTSSFCFAPNWRFNVGNWDIGLPLRYQEVKIEEGESERYWEIVLLWNQRNIWGGPFPVPCSGIPFKPVIHGADGRRTWSQGDNFTMTVGTSQEITPHFGS
jgi:F-box-like